MNEEYLQGFFDTYVKPKRPDANYNDWVSKISSNEEYKQGMFNTYVKPAKADATYEDWNGKIFGQKKTSSPSQEAGGKPQPGTYFNPQDPLGIGDAVVRQLYTGVTDQIPKSIEQSLEVLHSNLQASNIDEYIKRNKSVEFQKYVRERDPKFVGDGGFVDKAKGLFTPFDIDESLPKYRDQFVMDAGMSEIQKKIERKQPEIIARRQALEKYVQEQNIESAAKLGTVPQSYKDVKSVTDATRYAANMAAQGLWQIPLTVVTRGASGLAMESAEVYDQQLDQLAEKYNISREEVINRNLDKPAEGQFYATVAAGLDRFSAGGLLNLVKKGGSKGVEKLLAITTETLTEPTQGALEEMGGAAGSGNDVSEAFEKAWTVNLSKRLDESLGGFFGSAGPVMISSTTQKQGQVLPSTPEQGQNQEQNAPVENVRPEPNKQESKVSLQPSETTEQYNAQREAIIEKLNNGEPLTIEEADFLTKPQEDETPQETQTSEVSTEPQAGSMPVVPPQAVEQTAEEGGEFSSEEDFNDERPFIHIMDESEKYKKKYVDNAEPINISGVDAYVGKVDGEWQVFDKSTGAAISPGGYSKTKKQAISFATDSINKVGIEKFKEQVGKIKQRILNRNNGQTVSEQTEQQPNLGPAAQPNTTQTNTEVPGSEGVNREVGEVDIIPVKNGVYKYTTPNGDEYVATASSKNKKSNFDITLNGKPIEYGASKVSDIKQTIEQHIESEKRLAEYKAENQPPAQSPKSAEGLPQQKSPEISTKANQKQGNVKETQTGRSGRLSQDFSNSNEYYNLTPKDIDAYKYSSDELKSYPNSKIEEIYTAKIHGFPHAKTNDTNRAEREAAILDFQKKYPVVIKDENINRGWDILSLEDYEFIKKNASEIQNLTSVTFEHPLQNMGGMRNNSKPLELTVYSGDAGTLSETVKSFDKRQQLLFLEAMRKSDKIVFSGSQVEYRLPSEIKRLDAEAKRIAKIKTDDASKFTDELDRLNNQESGRTRYLDHQHIVNNVAENILQSTTESVENKTVSIPQEKSKIEVAKDQIAEGLDELLTALGGKANMMGQSRPDVVKALRKIGDGLIAAGLATAANVAQKIKEYLQEKGVLLDVDSYLNEVYEPTYDNKAIFTNKEEERQANVNPELSDVGRMYGTVSNELLTKEAARIAQDPAGERDVLNMGNDMNPALRRATALEITKKYKQEGDRENAQRMFDHYAKLGGDYATAVQYGQVAADDPWVITQSVVRKSRTANDKILAQPTPDGTVKETLQVAQGQLKEIGVKYGVEVAESDTVDSVIAKVLEKTSQQKLADSKEKISKARAERTNIIKAFKSNPSKYIDFGKAYSSVVPVPVLTKEGVQMAVKLARTYMTEGAASVEIAIAKVKEFLESQLGIKISDNDLKRISDEFNDAVVTKKANRIITKYTGQAKPKNKPVTVPNEDKLIIEKIRQLAGDQSEAIVDNYLTDNVNKAMVAKEIKEIIKQHYKGESYQEGIADRLVNELGLSEADAKLIQNIVKREFEKRAKAEAEKILTNTYGKASIPRPAGKAKTDADLIFEAINMGAFNDQFYRDLVGDKFGLVNLSDENVIELEKLADAIQSLPAGERKNRKLAEFYDYINKLKKADRKFERIADHALEMYYTSMLSGYSTVARGLKGAALTSSAHMIAGAIANPRATFQGLQGLKAFFRGAGSFGWDSWKSILRDGYNPIDYFDRGMTGTSSLTKIVNTPLSDLDGKKKAIKLFMYLPSKMTRMLYANDAIFRYGVREYEAYIEKYNDLIHEGGSPGEAKFWTRLNKELALDKTSKLESERQLEQEMAEMKANGENIPLGYDKRRLQEIVEEKRGEKLTKSANDKANQSVLMNDPVGTLGSLYRMMAGIGVIQDNDTKSKVIGKLVFRSIFPFMRVPTNFVNTTLDYTPVGLIRIARGGRETREGWREMTPDEKARHYAKFAIGATVFTSLLVSMFDLDDEEGFVLDPDAPIQVTANGKGEFTENTQITEDYKPYSFRLRKPDGTFTKWFSYQDNPIGMMLAPLGFMSDEMRFKDFKKSVNDKNYEPEARGVGYFGENFLWMALNFSSSQTYQQGLKKLLDLTGMNTNSEYNETNISSILYSPVKATAFPNLYKQTYQQAKALMGKPEKMAFSVPEKMLKDIPIFEELIDQEQHDQFGYPITRPLDWPLVPDAILEPMKEELDRRQAKKEWKLIYKYPEVTVGPRFRFPTKLNLNNEEKAKWSKMAGDKLRELVDDNYTDLNKMNALDLQKRINRYKTIATQYATANVRKK